MRRDIGRLYEGLSVTLIGLIVFFVSNHITGPMTDVISWFGLLLLLTGGTITLVDLIDLV